MTTVFQSEPLGSEADRDSDKDYTARASRTNYRGAKSRPPGKFTSKPKPSKRQRPLNRELVLGGLGRWAPLQTLEGVQELVSDLVGEPLDFDALYSMSMRDLKTWFLDQGFHLQGGFTKSALIEQYLNAQSEKDSLHLKLYGVLEPLGNGDACLVYERDCYELRAMSAFVPACLIEHCGLKRGHVVTVRALPPCEGASCPIAVSIDAVMGKPPQIACQKVPFEDLTPIYPQERILLSSKHDQEDSIAMRLIDLVAPIGLGQRGLIVAPPRVGKTMGLKSIARAIAAHRPEAKLMVLLIDECPLEVTEFCRQVKGEVVYSSFDQSAEKHVHAAEMVIHKARRLVEVGQDVVILLDSMTRLARAYNAVTPSSGKVLPSGLDASALDRPKRFFGAARNIEGGGSLTILATALVDTGSAVDAAIFEEFKAVCNMELYLDPKLAEARVFPAINIEKSGTCREELLYHPDELRKIYTLRRTLLHDTSSQAVQLFLKHLASTDSNVTFLSHLSDG